jgi:hypothetical protein
MGIKIKNTKFIVRNAKVRGGDISPAAQLGSIYRIINNSNFEPLTFTYTNVFSQSANVSVSYGFPQYVVALSGSFTDGDIPNSSLYVTDMFITSSVNTTPTFTEELITTTGIGTWTKPVGVTQVIVECWGGGGAGGGASVDGELGSGGSGGAFTRKLVTYTSPSANKSYSVAASVTGGTGNGPAGNDTTWETNVLVAKGGGGGAANDFTTQTGRGLPGTGNIGTIIYESLGGSTPASGRGGNVAGGGGFCPGSTNSNAGIEYGGLGTLGAGPGGAGANTNGLAGNNYGGGGSGAARDSTPSKTGGNGAQGLIRLIYR